MYRCIESIVGALEKSRGDSLPSNERKVVEGGVDAVFDVRGRRSRSECDALSM